MSDPKFKYGAVFAPLPESTEKGLLEDADPALAAMVELLAWGIDTYIGPRLLAQSRLNVGIKKLPGAVARKITTDPTPFLMANLFQFPLLALFRKREKWDEHTVAYDKSTAEWAFAYVLPPLMPEQIVQLNPILHAVSNTMRHILRRGDPAYPNGGVSAMHDAGVMAARLTEASYGTYQAIEGPSDFYRALTGTITVLEREMPVPSTGPKFAGNTSVGINHQSTDGTVMLDLSSSPVFETPTIDHISPTTGPTEGGTTLTIWGTGYRPDTQVRIFVGGVECTSAQVLGDTVVRGVTGPHQAFDEFDADIVVMNDDGQSATLPAAFTYAAP